MHNRRILMILVIWHEDRGSLTKPFLCTPESGETSLLKGRWRKLRYLDCLDLVIAVQIISAACVLHNYCLLHDDFDVGYFLPDHADGGGNLVEVSNKNHWKYNRKYPQVDVFLSSHHLSAWKCIYIVRRNYLSFTPGSERVKERKLTVTGVWICIGFVCLQLIFL